MTVPTTATRYRNCGGSANRKTGHVRLLLRQLVVARLMVETHRIPFDLAAFHASQFDNQELLRRLRTYAGMELSVAGPNNQSGQRLFHPVLTPATTTADCAALNPVPESASPPNAGQPMPESEIKNRERLGTPEKSFRERGFQGFEVFT